MEINGYAALKQYATEGQRVNNAAATENVTSNDSSVSALLDNRDKLSISADGQTARMKALLGFDPNSRITKKDFDDVITRDTEYVSQYLEDAVSLLDLASGKKFSISADDEGAIHIKGNIENRDEFEAALNQDEDFVKAFNRLSTNRRITDYAQQLTVSPQAQLIDYLSGNAASDLSSLIGGYEQARKMNDPFNALLFYSGNYSRPYEMQFEVE